MELQLDPVQAAVQGIAGRSRDMDWIRDGHRIEELLGDAVKPLNPSIGTTSASSSQGLGRSASPALKTCLERSSTMSRSRVGAVLARIPVRSMITVTY